MNPTPYKIHRIRRQLSHGITAASACTLNAILKFDGLESPHCVYNEKVAVRLGQTLHVPVAAGVLTTTSDGPAFASLHVEAPGMNLPNIIPSRAANVAQQYPREAATLMLFDILIGNYDRSGNLKASVVTPHISVFCAFDHSHALLNIEADPYKSIARLDSEKLIAEYHPFHGHLKGSVLDDSLKHLSLCDESYIKECCFFGKTFRAVSDDLQEKLANALARRLKNLPAIVARHRAKLVNQP